MKARSWTLTSIEDTVRLAEELVAQWQAGDIVLLSGELGVGKTTFVRAALRLLGYTDEVRSPTFSLIHLYPTSPPVLHADLYRLTSAAGLGLEDYLDTHLSFIEWPDRLGELLDGQIRYLLEFSRDGEVRNATLSQKR